MFARPRVGEWDRRVVGRPPRRLLGRLPRLPLRSRDMLGWTLFAALFLGCPRDTTPASAPHVALPAALRGAERAMQDARVRLHDDAGRLWGVRLDGARWMFVLDDRAFLTEAPEVAGFTRVARDLWAGPVPPHLSVANTAVQFGGKAWAMVLLPVPESAEDAVRLLIHEQWHVVQAASIPLPPARESADGAALLDSPEGRVWLVLEWRALAAALQSSGDAEDRAVEAALVFRARRYLDATPDERQRERTLDLTEGLAEYTAWRLSGGTSGTLANVLTTAAPSRESYVRSFPYADGPAYGFLLDRRRPGWTHEIANGSDMQRLLVGTLRSEHSALEAALVDGRFGDTALRAQTLGPQYGLLPLREGEDGRWRRHQQQLSELRERYLVGPTLRIRPGAMQITFNPQTQTPLDGVGTVMTGLVWKGSEGAQLAAPGGALVDEDWTELRVPLDGAAFTEGVQVTPVEVVTSEWDVRLPRGWTLRHDGSSWLATPP
jgi:hypothetical protein